MNILGLSLGILSTAALFVDGDLNACISQERFSREKNDETFPKDAIAHVMSAGGIKGSDLNAVVISGNMLNLSTHLMRKYSKWSLNDHFDIMDLFWKPKLLENRNISFNKIFDHKIDRDQFPGREKWQELIEKTSENYSDPKNMIAYKDFLHEIIIELLGVKREQIIHIDHHECHAAYAYWSSHVRGQDTLILTADAFGDGLSSTLSEINQNNNIKRLHSIKADEFQLGRIYRSITLLMAMMPDQHEFKVMGLAPYAKTRAVETAYNIFKSGMYVDDINFKYHKRPTDLFFYYKEKLQSCRFDGIAGGLQKYTEEIMLQYISNAMKKFNKKKLVFSGGISMNVKANMLIKDLQAVDEMFIAPSGGDESLAIGACYAYLDKNQYHGEIMPMRNAYLGGDIAQQEIEKCLSTAKIEGFYAYEYEDDFLAKLIADGNVVGRCCGRAEFGARSLGNRAIIADPRNSKIVEVINEKIKNRDFWMPFAPSILFEESEKYIKNEKNIFSPYMTVGFESTEKGAIDLQAAMHPADKTLRPQMVTKEMNPEYHSLLQSFFKLTGVGGVLNTSFNLHGFPIVNSAKDAYNVFKKSGIDVLAFSNFIVTKKPMNQ